MKRPKRRESHPAAVSGQPASSEVGLNAYQRFLAERYTRRRALSTGAKVAIGAGVVVIAGAAAYAVYASSTGSSTTTTSSTSTTSSTQTSSSTTSSTTSMTSSTSTPSSTTSSTSVSSNTNLTPLTFVHWHYRDDYVTGFVNQFMTEDNENVIQETLDNANYNPLIEAKFQSGEVFDMCYANVFEAIRLIDLGYTKNVEGMTNIAQIKSEMYPSIVAAYSDKNGNLAGLPYFWSARSCPVSCDNILGAANMSGERPQSWDDLWSMATKVKQAGAADYPVLPHWFNANYGIQWDFLGELANVSGDQDLSNTLFNKSFEPIFDQNSAVSDLLTTWATSTKNGLVDPSVFSMGGDDPFVTASLTGKYAFVPTAIYYFKSMNDPTQSQVPVGQANLTPVTKQPWGVIDTGLYCWPVKNHDDTRSQKLISFLGYKDPNSGKRLTQTAWAETDALSSGYTDTLQDPDVQAAFQQWLGTRTTDTLKTINDIANGMATPFIFKAALYSPLADQWFPILGSVASGSTDVTTGVSQLKQAADGLYSQYGSK